MPRITAQRIECRRRRRVIRLAGGVDACIHYDASWHTPSGPPRTLVLVDGRVVAWDYRVPGGDQGYDFELPYGESSVRARIDVVFDRQLRLREFSVWAADVLIYAEEDEGRRVIIGEVGEPLPIVAAAPPPDVAGLPVPAEDATPAPPTQRASSRRERLLWWMVLTALILGLCVSRTPQPQENAPAASVSRGRLDLDLLTAVKAGDLRVVRVLLARGAAANARRESSGSTALSLAAHFGRQDVAKLLIASGADVNATGRMVVEAGWDPSILDPEHQVTPLIEAVWSLDAPIVKLLLQHGADRDTLDSKGMTAFEWARSMIPTTDPSTSSLRMRRLEPVLALLQDRGLAATSPRDANLHQP